MNKRRSRFRWLRVILRMVIVLIALFIISCLIVDHYMQFRKTDAELEQVFADRNIKGHIRYYESHGRKLRYADVGEDSLPTLLFLHGSPGSMSYYAGRYSDSIIQPRFKVFAVDRPGYGYSGLGDAEPSIQKQSEMIRPILDSLHHVVHPVILVAGSYGSSIACRMAMDHPELIDGLVLTGPSLGPGLEQMFWFTPIIENWSIRWFIPRAFRTANTEKIHHREELEKMLPLWGRIKIPVVYLQGEKDNLIDTTNAGFARTHLNNAPYLDVHFFKGREHRLAQYEWITIRTKIIELYDVIRRNKAATQVVPTSP